MTSSSSVTLFRVQDDNGIGPYNAAPWDGQTEMCMEHCDDSHMSPHRDPLLGSMYAVEQCACETPESLLTWFDGWWEALAAAGFSVVVLTASEARIGSNGQAFYNRHDDVEERDTLDVDTFLGLFAPLADCATISS